MWANSCLILLENIVKSYYSGTSIQGTPLGRKQMPPEWRVGSDFLVINKQR